MSQLTRAVVFSTTYLVMIIVGALYVGWVSQLHTGLPLEPNIITDKEQYHVGDTIHATLQYFNPNQHSVSFIPPSTVYLYACMWPDTNPNRAKNPEECPGIAYLEWRLEGAWMIVGAKSEFVVYENDFKALRVGSEMIQMSDVKKLLQITD